MSARAPGGGADRCRQRRSLTDEAFIEGGRRFALGQFGVSGIKPSASKQTAATDP